MKYLKKYTLFLEEDEFDIKDTDKEDVKMSKEKLNQLESQMQEYQSKKSSIDTIYKAAKTIEETKVKIEEIIGKDAENRNPFLVEYNTVARLSKEIDIIHNEIVLDKLRADDFRQEASLVKDTTTKSAINSKLSDVQNRIAEKNKKIVEKQKEISDLTLEHENKMEEMKEELENYIKKISNSEQK
jgi:hypothetical protein